MPRSTMPRAMGSITPSVPVAQAKTPASATTIRMIAEISADSTSTSYTVRRVSVR